MCTRAERTELLKGICVPNNGVVVTVDDRKATTIGAEREGIANIASSTRGASSRLLGFIQPSTVPELQDIIVTYRSEVFWLGLNARAQISCSWPPTTPV